MTEIKLTQVQYIIVIFSFVLPFVMWALIKLSDVHLNMTYWHWLIFIAICAVLGVIFKRGDFIIDICISRFLYLLFLANTHYYYRDDIVSRYSWDYKPKDFLIAIATMSIAVVILYIYFNLFFNANTLNIGVAEFALTLFKFPDNFWLNFSSVFGI